MISHCISIYYNWWFDLLDSSITMQPEWLVGCQPCQSLNVDLINSYELFTWSGENWVTKAALLTKYLHVVDLVIKRCCEPPQQRADFPYNKNRNVLTYRLLIPVILLLLAPCQICVPLIETFYRILRVAGFWFVNHPQSTWIEDCQHSSHFSDRPKKRPLVTENVSNNNQRNHHDSLAVRFWLPNSTFVFCAEKKDPLGYEKIPIKRNAVRLPPAINRGKKRPSYYGFLIVIKRVRVSQLFASFPYQEIACPFHL